MKLYYLPYSMVSMSVKELQKVLGGLKIKPDGNYAFAHHHLVVNWGHGSCPYWGNKVSPKDKHLLNHWEAVHDAVNKLRTFKKLKAAGVPTPAWTTSKEEARKWVEQGNVVFCRTKLSSMEGRGIVVATSVQQLVNAPLYTRLFQKDKEYRVHIFKGEVIDYVQKKLKHGALEIKGRNKYIRNTANGWIFAREGVELPAKCASVARDAVSAVELDFGAVDLAVNELGKVVVFEINTAPGIEGTTIKRYTDAITSYMKGLK